jgi:hypothetical protein
VADDHQAAGVRLKVAQPTDRVGIEVVGGLVEQQRRGRIGPGGPTFRGGEQDPGQLDPAALTAGEGAQLLGQDPFGQAETGTDPPGLALGGVTAERGEALLEVTVATDGLVARVLVDHLGHQRLLLLQIGQQRVQAAGREHPIAGQDVQVALAGSCGR